MPTLAQPRSRWSAVLIASLAVALVFTCSCGGGAGGVASAAPPANNPPAAPSYLQMAADGVATLQSNWYNQKTGLWNTTSWWNAANSVTVLVEYSKLSNSTQFLPAISNTYTLNSGGGFLNNYYDDEGWWALAWIAAYDLTGNSAYLATANAIFSDMTGGWDDTCGGGVWWSKARTYKNAIANELFLSVAANLASRESNAAQKSTDLSWAQKEWQWFSQSGMINSQNLINDGLTSSCQNNGKTTWTYNQGVILGGLSALSADAQDSSLLSSAQSIALAAISHLTDQNGVLHDPCEPNCGADGVQFKGIFARNLAVLDAASPNAQYVTFLDANAQSIWNNDQGPGYQFGLVWSGPFQNATSGNAAAQTSALDCLLAAAETSPGGSP